jgi:hypothetical protein
MRFKLIHEKPGVISEEKVWVFTDNRGYMYIDESLIRLLLIIITEWKSDRHLIG